MTITAHRMSGHVRRKKSEHINAYSAINDTEFVRMWSYFTTALFTDSTNDDLAFDDSDAALSDDGSNVSCFKSSPSNALVVRSSVFLRDAISIGEDTESGSVVDVPVLLLTMYEKPLHAVRTKLTKMD